MEYFLQLFFARLSRGSMYALIALGYTLVYGIIELINFAHGEICMIGAFMGLIVAGALTALGLPTLSILVIALIIAVLYSAAYGYTVEKIAYKPLRGAPRLAPLIIRQIFDIIKQINRESNTTFFWRSRTPTRLSGWRTAAM
jgi:branched-chain amino acid transport system permease protein